MSVQLRPSAQYAQSHLFGHWSPCCCAPLRRYSALTPAASSWRQRCFVNATPAIPFAFLPHTQTNGGGSGGCISVSWSTWKCWRCSPSTDQRKKIWVPWMQEGAFRPRGCPCSNCYPYKWILQGYSLFQAIFCSDTNSDPKVHANSGSDKLINVTPSIWLNVNNHCL